MKNLFLICIAVSYFFISPAIVKANDLYKVGINDMLEIRVLEHNDLRTTTVVSSDGTITFPLIGSVYVKGMSVSDIEKEITNRLGEGFIKYPQVSVSLVKSMSRKIYTYGELLRRGEIPIDEGMTVIKALSVAGGLGTDGLYGKLKIRRKKDNAAGYKDLVEADFQNGFITDRAIEDMLLQDDDMLVVERNKTFIVSGEVGSRTGEFALTKDMTVWRAISIAGGVRPEGLYGTLKIRRKQKDSSQYEDIIKTSLNNGNIESEEIKGMLLEPDDFLVVERNKTFFIYGELGKTGEIVLEKDMTVEKALSIAGGVRPDGLYGTLKVRRKQEGSFQYDDIVVTKFNNGVIESTEIKDMLLEPDDFLVVERNKTFFIYGEVNKTGEFVLQDNMTVLNAITIAGGFTKWGSESRVKVLRPTSNEGVFAIIKVDIKDVLKGDANADVKLQPRDIIVVSTGIF